MEPKFQLDFGDSSPENSLMHSGTAVAAKPDFSGWATRYNLECADGRTILTDAFLHQDKMKVPLVWQHGHDDPENVLGHAILEHREGEGVYTYGYFNGTQKGKNAKEMVEHEDIDSLSIFANKLKETAKKVSHGLIREVSLVLARANPGALIDNVELQHGDGEIVTIEDEVVIFTGETLKHGDDAATGPDPDSGNNDDEGVTVQDVYNDMSDEQKQVVHYYAGAAMDHALENNGAGKPGTDGTVTHSGSQPADKENASTMKSMTRNVFDQTAEGTAGNGEAKHQLSHDDIKGIVADAMKMGSLKEAVEGYAVKHGIENIDVLFPDARTITDTPEFDSRRIEWVRGVINGTRHTPFSRIKSIVADITQDEARARGYVKGTLKKEEWFGLTKRVTTPTTIYKKQQLDRDDILDITDFDVVTWLKAEMRLMLEEELARAILISDGRAVDHEDKIKDPAGSNEGAGIRSILNDHELYAATVNVNIDDASSSPSEIVDAVLNNMRFYKGSGEPTFYTTLPMLTKMLLAKDGLGRRLYRTKSDLAAELGVKDIVTVEVMESVEDLIGIIVNLQDYAVGADRGGDVTFFDDFDIDYNQYKYLIESRLSGALTKIRSALVVKAVAAEDELIEPNEPAFVPATGVVTIPVDATQNYENAETGAPLADGAQAALDPGESITVRAVPTAGNYFSSNVEDEWTFTRDEA